MPRPPEPTAPGRLVLRENDEPVGIIVVDVPPRLIIRAGERLDVLDAPSDSLRAKLGPYPINL